MHSVTSARALPAARSARWCVCLHLVCDEDAALRFNVTCCGRRKRLTDGAHRATRRCYITAARCRYFLFFLRPSERTHQVRSPCARNVFTRSSFAKTGAVVWLRSAREPWLSRMTVANLKPCVPELTYIYIYRVVRPWGARTLMVVALSPLSFTLELSLSLSLPPRAPLDLLSACGSRSSAFSLSRARALSLSHTRTHTLTQTDLYEPQRPPHRLPLGPKVRPLQAVARRIWAKQAAGSDYVSKHMWCMYARGVYAHAPRTQTD